ncbi:MAG: universal stress protein UspA [Planctomycetota bacterium]|nr:MAG: universal stress protein UspA [Planctomycetota bacterium]
MEFRKILVGTDFSEPAARALAVAAGLAARLDARLVVLSVVDTRGLDGAAMVPELAGHVDLGALVASLELAAGRRVEQWLAEAKLPPEVRAIAVARRGVPAETIVQAARELEADLIVLGTMGRSGLSRLLFGSVADKVVRTSPVPVLTVGPKHSGATAPAGSVAASESAAARSSGPAAAPPPGAPPQS